MSENQISTTESASLFRPNMSNIWANVSADNENNVELEWDKYINSEKGGQVTYNIYRNDILIANTENTVFVDQNIMVGGFVSYSVRIVYGNNPGIEHPFSNNIYIKLKHPLTIIADNVTRYVGVSNPNVSERYTIRGFIGNDNPNYLSKRPVSFIDPFIYDLSIPIGVYNNAVTVSGAEDVSGKYRFIYLSGSLIVSPLSNNASLSSISLDGVVSSVVPQYYAIDCSNTRSEVEIVVNPSDIDATVQLLTSSTGHLSGKIIKVKTDKPSKQDVVFSIVSQDGSANTEHRITIERYFSFDDIVINRWGNVLAVINNPVNNGGYKFLTYKWYRNGRLVGVTQAYSTSEGDTEDSNYYLEVTTDKGETLRTCISAIKLISNTVKIYPNPVSVGETVTVDADVEDVLLENAVIEVYNISGVKVKEVKVIERVTEISLDNSASGTYIFKFKSPKGFSKELKVIKK